MQVFLGRRGGAQGDHFVVVLNVEVKLVHRIDFPYAPGGFMAFEGLDLGSPKGFTEYPFLK